MWRMIKLYNKATKEFNGRISEGDMEFLADHLEEESIRDSDYYLRKETIEGFAAAGASPRLMEVLRGGLRNDSTIEIRWDEDQDGE